MSKDYNQAFWDSLDNIEEVKVKGDLQKFKLQNKNEKTRVAFPLINPKTGKLAVKTVEVFKYNSKDNWANFQAPADKESKAYKTAVKYAGYPQAVSVTIVLKYETNAEGRVINGEEYTLIPLTLPNQRLSKVKSLQAEYDFKTHDLIVECEEPKFQKLDFRAVPGSGLWEGVIKQKTKSGEVKNLKVELDADSILRDAIDMMQDADLVLGSRWTDDQIIAFFEKVENGGAGDDYETEDYEAEAEKKAMPVKRKPAAAEVDEDMVDDTPAKKPAAKAPAKKADEFDDDDFSEFEE